MEHAKWAAARLQLIGSRRLGHRALGNERDDGVDPGIDALDLRQVGAKDLARGDLLAPNPGASSVALR